MGKAAKHRRSAPAGSDWSEFIREEPVTAVAVAGITGFFAGGGAMTAPGRIATSIVARIVAREVAAGVAGALLANFFARNDDGRAGKTED